MFPLAIGLLVGFVLGGAFVLVLVTRISAALEATSDTSPPLDWHLSCATCGGFGAIFETGEGAPCPRCGQVGESLPQEQFSSPCDVIKQNGVPNVVSFAAARANRTERQDPEGA